MASVMLEQVRKSHGRNEILHGIDLAIAGGEFAVFVGPSGCGKSTLLRVIAGLEDIDAGRLRIGDRVVNGVPPSQRGVAMVFQSYALYPHMTVRDNISFGLKLAKTDRAAIDRAVTHAADVLQLGHLLDRKPKELSGGQRQRVAIGRAIVRKPEVFLFDEPLSNLDAALRVHMRVEIARLHRELGKTAIYVTHDQVEAMTLADRIVVLNGGRVEQVGAPLELYRSPANMFVAGFIGSPKMNFLAATADGAGNRVRLTNDSVIGIEAPAGTLAPLEQVTVGVRPEHLHLAAVGESNTVRGTVTLVERLGDVSYLHVEIDRQELPLMVRAAAGVRTQAGESVAVRLPPGFCHVFDARGTTVVQAPGE
jgi:multiple sugar transport system ATP-binding protein